MILVLAVGLSLRIALVAFHERPLISDEREYSALASNLSSTGSYEINGVPTAYRPIGYPAFVGGLYFAFGNHPAIVKLAQAFCDTTTAFLLFFMLPGLPNRTRIIAAGIWALYIPAIYYVNFLLSETVYTFLLTLFAFLFIRFEDNRKGRSALIGIIFGFLILIKPGTLLLLVFLPICIKRMKISAVSVLPTAMTLFLVLTPWLVRNYLVFDKLALSSNGGINFLIGNNPHTTGAYGISFDPQILGSTHGEFDADRQAYDWAVKYIMQNPDRFIVNAVKKLGHLFESEGGLIVWSFHPDPENTQTRYSSKYASIPLALTLFANLPYFLALLLGIVGFLGSRRDSIWWFTACLSGTWLVLHSIVFGGGRFHHPLMPFVVLFAAVSIAGGWTMIKGLTRVQLLAGSFFVFCFVSLWIYEGIAVYHG